MSSDNYYLLTFLPGLDSVETESPVSPEEFLSSFDESSGLAGVVRTIFISDDLLQRDAFMSGEIKEVSPMVLSPEACRDEQPLPDELLSDPGASVRKIAADVVWEIYFTHAAETAEAAKNVFLRNWVGFEVFLRNALVEVRAEALELEPADYFIARDLEESNLDPAAAIAEWKTAVAENPLKAQMVLDRFRWEWLELNEKYFSFADDELAAYGAKLLLVWRWKRIEDEMNNTERT